MVEKKTLVAAQRLLLLGILLGFSQTLRSENCLHSLNGQYLYDRYRFSVMLYQGWSVNNSLFQVMTLQHLNRWPENVSSVELAYTLQEDNFLRRLVRPLVGVVQLAANGAVRHSSHQPNIYEFNPYLLFRWANLPWNNIITTSFAIGEGVSYDSSVAALERKNHNKDAKRFLNYLVFEATIAHPHYPRWQVLAKIHHRSGCFGLYHAGNSGSNVLGVGLRYLFD